MAGGLVWSVVAGVVLIAAGIGLRGWSIATLRRFSRYQIKVQPGHRVVTGGPYRYVRHPSYTGIALVLAGIALACDDVWSVVAVAVLGGAGLAVRIRAEERQLTRALGAEYEHFAAGRKRLMPGVWLLPGEHLVDSGYPSAELLVSSRADYGITLVTPMLADTSPQARAGAGFDRAAFAIDFDNRQATCPQGHASSYWNPVAQRGTGTIVITFAKGTCGPCPVRAQCTTSASQRRQLTVHPREIHQAQLAARATQDTRDFQARYALRAGVEGTIRQGVAVTGMRRARYRGLAKTRLEHASAAVALNLIRLDAWWNGHPLDRTRTSHLACLELALAS